MKPISILIPNRNSFEAIQLAIESVRKYTKHPHKIIVYDDRSINDTDAQYLERAKARGWIELHQGTKHIGHGGVLNELVNRICDTEYAVIMDSDVEIRASGWIQDFLSVIDKDTIAIVDTIAKRTTWKGYNVPVSNASFCFLNMEAYRDGMEVDWRSVVGGVDRRQEPYESIFADIYPPAISLKNLPNFNENFVSVDPGAKFWLKVNYENPKGYKVAPIPPVLKQKYHHYDHISFISIPDPSYPANIAVQREIKFSIIKDHLKGLRCQS